MVSVTKMTSAITAALTSFPLISGTPSREELSAAKKGKILFEKQRENKTNCWRWHANAPKPNCNVTLHNRVKHNGIAFVYPRGTK